MIELTIIGIGIAACSYQVGKFIERLRSHRHRRHLNSLRELQRSRLTTRAATRHLN